MLVALVVSAARPGVPKFYGYLRRLTAAAGGPIATVSLVWSVIAVQKICLFHCALKSTRSIDLHLLDSWFSICVKCELYVILQRLNRRMRH